MIEGTKYKIGDELFTIRDNKIIKITVEDFSLDDRRDLTLKERFSYVIKNVKGEDKVESLSNWYTNEDKRKESKLFLTVDELLEDLKKEYDGIK